MKIYKKTIFTTILFLTCITNTYAACTQEEIDEFKKVEEQYTIKYEFNKDTKDYTVMFFYPINYEYAFSLNEDIPGEKIKESKDGYFSYSRISPGEYTIEIVGTSETCNDVLKKTNIKLEKYNTHYGSPECEGIEEFVLCQPTYDKEIDYDTFVSRVNTYKKTKEKKENKDTMDEINKENEIISYIQDNLIQIIIVVTFIILLLITAYIGVKSVRKRRRLE